ncbi:hypothetical protein COO60DRAFT_10853 [Scenedesmus sp. NREL 46B-D3]|nr:hypothetical protein COO60DRAFT_10853 [Scenedesmus sp. NREL 46B-D3]
MYLCCPQTCGGGLAQGFQRPSVTPRQWLDQRWQRQAGSNGKRHKLAAAAIDSIILPTHSSLASRSSSGSSSTLSWDSLSITAVPLQQLVAKPAFPSHPVQQQLPRLADGSSSIRAGRRGSHMTIIGSSSSSSKLVSMRLLNLLGLLGFIKAVMLWSCMVPPKPLPAAAAVGRPALFSPSSLWRPSRQLTALGSSSSCTAAAARAWTCCTAHAC